MGIREKIEEFYSNVRPNRFGIRKYLLKDGRKHKAAIIVPGGAYERVCSFVEGRPIAERLNALGYSAFVIYYRCKDKALFPSPMDDLGRGVKEILEKADQYNILPSYSLWGFSAGGHLAASFGTEEIGAKKYGLPSPSTLVLSYPVVTMGELGHPLTRENLLGKNPSEDMIKKTSIEKLVTPSYPPTFLWCGDSDDVVDKENTLMLQKSLMENSVECRTTIYPGIGHGVGLAFGTVAEGWIEEAVAFWESHSES